MSTASQPRPADRAYAGRAYAGRADPAAEPVDYDVLIVGAGLSGIGAAYHLRRRCPKLSVGILEARDTLGGTWDLFRYPGIRSDSDMFTLGYSFRPWHSEKAISEGRTILDYIRDTAREFGIDRSIRFGHRLKAANWDSQRARWVLTVVRGSGAPQEEIALTCRFLYLCSGYYDYEAGYAPQWPEMDQYRGELVHPQHWPEDLDYAGKRVVVIGSGATAVTLVPSLAVRAAHVTMLQRSPTYIVSIPARDKIADRLRRWLPAGIAHRLIRTKNVALMMYLYNLARRKPDKVKQLVIGSALKQTRGQLDAKHLTPSYNPWDQRLCLVPNGDLFKAIRNGQATIVTDRIERFTPHGLQLKSGARLDADLIVTATGLKLQLAGGAELSLDGRPIDLSKSIWYKGMMYSGVPNLAASFGYTNASWTLKAELIAQYVCRLLNHMDAHGFDTCMPVADGAGVEPEPAINLSSGYVQRAAALLPKQGGKRPWKVYQNYARDVALFKFGSLDDGAMCFGHRRAARTPRHRHPSMKR